MQQNNKTRQCSSAQKESTRMESVQWDETFTKMQEALSNADEEEMISFLLIELSEIAEQTGDSSMIGA